MSQEKWFIFIILLFVLTVSLLCSLPFISVETYPDGYLVGKDPAIHFFECVVESCFVTFYEGYFQSGIYVGTLNLITSIPGPIILLYEPPHWKTNNLPRRKQRRRSASQCLCFRYSDSTVPLLLKSEILSF